MIKLIKLLPNEIEFKILQFYYHLEHNKKLEILNKQFKKFILEDSDVGSIILYRMDGMPLLIE